MNQIRFLTVLLAVSLSASSALASAPTIIDAAAKGNPNGFNLTFSEPVDPATATNAANYSISGGITVTGASLLYGTNETTIVVHTTDLTGTGPFTVTVNGVTDQVIPANMIAPNSAAIIRRSTGTLLNRAYGGINGGSLLGGTTVFFLTNAVFRFPNSPDLVEWRPEASIVPYRANNYGSYLAGFLEPPATGEYRFLIAARDQAILYLSTDATAANKRPIAGEPQFGWNGPRQYLDPNNRTFNSVGGSEPQSWVAANFPNRSSNDAFINDSLSAFGSLTLEAGKRYYFEALVKSGGFDWLDIAWQRPGAAAVTNGQPAIAGAYLSPLPWPTDGPVHNIMMDGNPVVPEGSPFKLIAAAAGTPPLALQWFRHDDAIPDATNHTLNVPFVNMNDDGTEFRLRVRNEFSEAFSDVITLSIIPDTVAPTVVHAAGSHQFDRVWVEFSETLDPSTALEIANYRIESVVDGSPLPITGLLARTRGIFDQVSARDITAILLLTDRQVPGMRYRIIMTGLKDRAAVGNPLAAPGQIEFSAWVRSPGFMLVEAFTNQFTDPLESFEFDHPDNFPPAYSTYLTAAEQSDGNAFLSRLIGMVRPAASGDHRLAISASAQARLAVQLDGLDHPASLVAARNAGSAPRQWDFAGMGPHVTAVLPLVAGEDYGIQLTRMPGVQPSHMALNWAVPNGVPPVNGTGTALTGELIASFADPDWAAITIVEHPVSATVDEFASVTLRASAFANPQYGWTSVPLIYRWQKDGTDLPGAAGNQLVLGPLAPGDSGVYRCRVIAPGKSVYTDEAVLAVIPHPLPEPDVAYALPDRRKVIVRFTGRIGSQMASTPGVFTIPGLTISSVTVRPDLESVELTTSLQTAGQLYTVNVHAIFDFDGTPVALPVSPVQVSFTGPVLTSGFVLREVYTNITGFRIADLTNHVSFPAQPSRRDFLSGIDYSETPAMINAGVRISGWITPPTDGAYNFYIAGDYQALLYLSSDESPANKIPVAMEPEWNGYRNFSSNEQRINIADGLSYFPWAFNLPVNRTGNTVGPRNLLASQRYYFEVLKKKGSGGADHVAVAMVPAGSPPPANGTPGMTGAAIASYLSPDNRITITQQPQSISVPNQQHQRQFSVGAVPLIGGPLTYQWFRNGVAVSGAVNASVTLQPGLPGSSIPVTCRISAPGAPAVMSAPAYFMVEPVAINLGRTGDFWQLNLPQFSGTYRVERATNFPPTGGWQFLQDVPGYLGGWQFEQEFPTEFFRVELREP